jgi:hypothetical protein
MARKETKGVLAGMKLACSNLIKRSEKHRKVTSGKYSYFQVFCTL